jgi:hypothetical protein
MNEAEADRAIPQPPRAALGGFDVAAIGIFS